MAAHNRYRAAQYDTALIVANFSMKSTNSTPLRSQNTVAITLPAYFRILNFFRSRGLGIFPLHACTLYRGGVVVKTRLASSENGFEEFMTMNGVLLEE